MALSLIQVTGRMGPVVREAADSWGCKPGSPAGTPPGPWPPCVVRSPQLGRSRVIRGPGGCQHVAPREVLPAPDEVAAEDALGSSPV